MSAKMKLADFKQDDNNANLGTERGRKMIQASLKQHGAGRSILVDKHGTVIGGNKTVEAAAAIGMDEVIVVPSDGTKLIVVQRTDLDLDADPKARELAFADNRTAEANLNWSVDKIVDAVQDPNINISSLWDEGELQQLTVPEDKLPEQLIGDADDAPDAPADPVTKPGDVWILGDHRVMCGDSTVITDVERLMDGRKAVCMWTDPPYGVNYVGKTKNSLTIKNDGAQDLAALLRDAFNSATMALQEGAAIYVAHPPGALNVTFGNAFLGAGWRLHQTLIWDKGTIVLGHSDYHFAHEPIFMDTRRAAVDSGAAARDGTETTASAASCRSQSHLATKPTPR